MVEHMRLFGLPAEASRLDVSAHPFSTLIGPADARITIRYDEADFTNALLSAAHETGHALYSLGHTAAHYGTPMCSVEVTPDLVTMRPPGFSMPPSPVRSNPCPRLPVVAATIRRSGWA